MKRKKSITKKILNIILVPPISNLFALILKIFTSPYKKVYFVASTGRSGTDSLSKLFESNPDFYSMHEPIPVMNKFAMIEYNNANSRPMKKLYWNSKRNMIRLGQFKHKKYYIESNHMFIKGFAEEAFKDFGNKIEVIHLYRDPVKVAKSIFELEAIPGTYTGNRWYLDYKAKNNMIQIENELDTNDDFRHDYYKCLWYWYEIEARTFFWRNKYKTIKFIDFKTENLNNYNEVIMLLNEMDIPYNPKLIKSILGITHNQKKSNKTEVLNMEIAEKMHAKFKKLLYNKGFIELEFNEKSLPVFRL